jgi:hypothetical protein
MPSDFRAEVRGLVEAQRNIEATMAQLHGPEMAQAMRDCTLMVQRDAKLLVPVDTGRLRASITPEVRMDGNEVMGVVGSNVKYAPYIETGTRPHWPPMGAIWEWVEHKGRGRANVHLSVLRVMRAIAKRGTKAYRYLQGAFEKNEGQIKRRIDGAVGRIVRR